MIKVTEQKTDNPVYSMGRSNMTQEQIWDVEDNGGFRMTTVFGEANPNRNHRYYSPETIKKAVADFNQRIKNGESIAVTRLNDDYSIPVEEAYAKVTDMYVTNDNRVAVNMVLLDTPNGNMMKNLINSVNKDTYSLKLDGIASKDNLDYILNVMVDKD